MEKSELKAEAIKLNKEGHSYGDIASRLGVPKSTVYHWINDQKYADESFETPLLTPPETVFESISGLNETENETKDGHKGNDGTMSSADRLILETEKAKMEHEVKMEELNFLKKQYNDKKLKSQKDETQKIITESEERHHSFLQGLNRKIEKNNKESVKPKVEIPKEIYIVVEQLFQQYLAFELEGSTRAKIYRLLEEANSARNQVFDWAKENTIPLYQVTDLRYFNELCESISNTMKTMDDEIDYDYNITLTNSFKKRYNNWIRKSLQG